MTDIPAPSEPTIKASLDALKLSNDTRAQGFANQGAIMDFTGALVEWIVEGFVDDPTDRDKAHLTWQVRRAAILDIVDTQVARRKLLAP